MIVDATSPYPQLLLWDSHGEYTGTLLRAQGYPSETDEPDKDRRIAQHVNIDVLFDFDACRDVIESLDGDLDAAAERAGRAFDDLFPGVAAALDIDLDPPYGTVWRVTGSIDGLVRAFRAALEGVSDTPSGDDDTFDYWPGWCRLVEQMAHDLDQLRAQVDDHGPGCDGPLNCVCTPFIDEYRHAVDVVIANDDLPDEVIERVHPDGDAPRNPGTALAALDAATVDRLTRFVSGDVFGPFDTATLGLPYAPAGVDEHGYYVECPVCHTRCRAEAGPALDEDRVTKDAGAAYADHYTTTHQAQ